MGEKTKNLQNDGENKKTIKEKLWCDILAATLHGGISLTEAEYCADEALKMYDKRIKKGKFI